MTNEGMGGGGGGVFMRFLSCNFERIWCSVSTITSSFVIVFTVVCLFHDFSHNSLSFIF